MSSSTNPDSLSERADHDWMTARGWEHFDFLNYMFTIQSGEREVNGRVEKWWCGIMIDQLGETLSLDSSSGGELKESFFVPCRCTTRADVMQLESMFKLAVKNSGPSSPQSDTERIQAIEASQQKLRAEFNGIARYVLRLLMRVDRLRQEAGVPLPWADQCGDFKVDRPGETLGTGEPEPQMATSEVW